MIVLPAVTDAKRIKEAYDYQAEFILTGITESNYLGYVAGSLLGLVGEGTAGEVIPQDPAAADRSAPHCPQERSVPCRKTARPPPASVLFPHSSGRETVRGVVSTQRPVGVKTEILER